MKPSRSETPARRRRARELALQGLYHGWLSGNAAEAVRLDAEQSETFGEADAGYFFELFEGINRELPDIGARLAPFLDRPFESVSPVERAALAIGAYELLHRLDIPYRVAINEAVELAKAYGGTDGHRYVNGVLDRLAGESRPREVERSRGARSPRRPRAS